MLIFHFILHETAAWEGVVPVSPCTFFQEFFQAPRILVLLKHGGGQEPLLPYTMVPSGLLPLPAFLKLKISGSKLTVVLLSCPKGHRIVYLCCYCFCL